MKSKKREIDVVVISDVHLGTYGSHAKELHNYLRRIKPGILVLNGDIIDFWQFSKRYWPVHHMKVVKDIFNMASKGTKVYYITGNHDETMRKFTGMHLGNIEVINKLELYLNGTKTLFFHGDVFDVIMNNAPWLEKIGALGYDYLIILNVFVNYISRLFGRGKISLSKRIKDNVKTAVKYISHFENTAVALANSKGYHAVVCGHIHQPEIREMESNGGGKVTYMNSGDWVENLTALEFHLGIWKIYHYHTDNQSDIEILEEDDLIAQIEDLDSKDIFRLVQKEFLI
jgi:UDP-2,3-diacylglucosamine pyrophosphatase LpxH